MGKVIGIVAIKGGVGKTTTVSNLGAILFKYFRKNILLVDANFSGPNLGLHFGITDPKRTIHDVLLDKIEIEDALVEFDRRLHILPGALLSKKVNSFKLKEIVDSVREYYDLILIDSSPNLNEEILSTMIASDRLLVVTTPDYPTLSTTLRAVRLSKQKKIPIVGLVMNKVRNKKFELTLKDIEGASETPVLAVIPDDTKILESLYLVKPAALNFENSKAVLEFKKLAACLVGEKYPDHSVSHVFKRLFIGDTPKEEMNREILRSLIEKQRS
jgi:septum site-determining protein MinD